MRKCWESYPRRKNEPRSIRHTRIEPKRFTEVFFGDFRRFFLACRQASGVLINKNPSKKPHCKVRSSFCGQNFSSGEESRAVNPAGSTSDLTMHGRKFSRKNRFGSDSRMPTVFRRNTNRKDIAEGQTSRQARFFFIYRRRKKADNRTLFCPCSGLREKNPF